MAEEYENIQPPQMPTPQIQPTVVSNYKKFPYLEHAPRLKDYDYYEMLFFGQHFQAFKIRIDNKAYGEVYNMLRYVKVNFAGLVSKIVADFLFSEPVKIKVPGGDQEFVDKLVEQNNLHIQNYESALSNSYFGDELFKIRTGRRHPNNTSEKPTIIIEETTPKIFFPHTNQFNVRQDPETIELAWMFESGGEKYLRKEMHMPRKVVTELYRMKGEEVQEQLPISMLGEPGLAEEQETKIDQLLVFHVPNWKPSGRYFGVSDYYDLDNLFYAINNRLTKNDNILDKHSDPILAVPEGILDENGKVKRERLNMVEIPAGSGDDAKPEYIVWNANLENAFTQIDKLVDMLFMVAEISPDTLGRGTGQSDSGRALKLKIMRTLAKVARKKIYYDKALKDVIYTAQVLAKEWGYEVDGKKLKGEPVRPTIEWSDGIPVDELEQVEIEVKRKDADLTTTADSLMRIDGLEEDEAKKKAKEIQDEAKINMPESTLGGKNPFNKSVNNQQLTEKTNSVEK